MSDSLWAYKMVASEEPEHFWGWWKDQRITMRALAETINQNIGKERTIQVLEKLVTDDHAEVVVCHATIQLHAWKDTAVQLLSWKNDGKETKL